MPARVVEGRAAHDRHQQRDLAQVELHQWLAEVELTGEAEAMNGAIAVLAERISLMYAFMSRSC